MRRLRYYFEGDPRSSVQHIDVPKDMAYGDVAIKIVDGWTSGFPEEFRDDREIVVVIVDEDDNPHKIAVTMWREFEWEER